MSYSNSIKNAAIGLAMATGLTCSYIEPAKADGLGDTEFVVSTNSGRLNVRQKPSTSSKVVGKLNKGSKVTVTDVNGNNWAKIQTGGWVSMQYLKAVSNPEYDNVVEQENKAEANLFAEERRCHQNWLKSENQNGSEFIVECNDRATVYEHGSDLYRPVFKLQDGAKITGYYVLENSPYMFISYDNTDGKTYHGYIAIWDTSYGE